MPLPEAFLQELKTRSDITEIASQYVSLKRRGRNMVGLCPFHSEKTPSFNVYSENGSFYCFGCGVGGDVITFVMRIENLDYIEAVRFLAQRAGMDMPESGYDDSMSKLRLRIYEANREAARFFHSALCSDVGKSGLDYLRRRALSDRTVRRFGLGYADEGWDTLCGHLLGKGFSQSELIAANLAVGRKNGKGIYDRFRSRIIFPIIDLRGNVTAFGGRVLTDEKPKYLNTSDTPVFKKSENLFSLNNAKNSGSESLILCEGYMDVIALNQAGFTNAVATLGTALTSEQALLMKRYCKDVIICYDADEAGQKATSRAIDILRKVGLPIRIITVPSGKDPDEFIRENGSDGAAAFGQLIESSGSDIEYRLSKLRANYRLDTVDGRVAYFKESLKLIASIESPVEINAYRSVVCAETQIDANVFNTELSKLQRKNKRESVKKRDRQIEVRLSGLGDRANAERRKRPRSSKAEESLLVYLINNPNDCEEIYSRVPPEKISNPLIRKFYEYTADRLRRGVEPLAGVSADFTPDELSVLYRCVNSAVSNAVTKQAMNEYIQIINEESGKITSENAADSTYDEINDYLAKLRESKK